MSIEEELKHLIIERYSSVRALTQAIEVPYSTIDNMLKRGIGGCGVSTVLKLCNALNIDVDALNEGKILSKTNLYNANGLEISTHETEIIKKYRALDERGKSAVENVLNFEYDALLGEKANNVPDVG